eukprot:TRINITY_DN4112_c0_g1_i2.p1 TRINITY_DN4112_c0_g1~~TRINITY_DN4112_c0_g1_i2.p1  ORF type:complete len:129 (-),score=16.43 TRINITY_DN4112_c0_g1_i2:187-573(-)
MFAPESIGSHPPVYTSPALLQVFPQLLSKKTKPHLQLLSKSQVGRARVLTVHIWRTADGNCNGTPMMADGKHGLRESQDQQREEPHDGWQCAAIDDHLHNIIILGELCENISGVLVCGLVGFVGEGVA